MIYLLFFLSGLSGLIYQVVWVRLLGASWFVTIGLLVGGAALPRANDTPIIREDYAGCIGKARYEHPVTGNQYQELVNALYACDVYEGE